MVHTIGDRIARIELDIATFDNERVTTSYRVLMQGDNIAYTMRNTDAFTLQELEGLRRILNEHLNKPLNKKLISFENTDFNIWLYDNTIENSKGRATLHGEFVMNFLEGNIPTGGYISFDFNERDIKRMKEYLDKLLET